MHPLAVTSLYAGLAALFYLGLSLEVIRLRWRERVPMLDGGRENLIRTIRTHANFAEYVPLALLMLALLESSNHIPHMALHALGIALLAGRCAHVYSGRVFEQKHDAMRGHTYYFRGISVVLTFGVISISALMLICIAL